MKISPATLILIGVALFLLWFVVNADEATSTRVRESVRGSVERLRKRR